MMLREGLTGMASPQQPLNPYYHPSPQQRHHHSHPHHPPPDFNMSYFPPSSSTARFGPQHHHHRGHGVVPGSGGLFSIADSMSSPPGMGSFQMSMLDASTSTPTNVGGRRGGTPFRGGVLDVSGLKDLNNFVPLHKIKLDDYPKRLFTVENNVTGDTIVVVTTTQKVQLFILKIKNDTEAKSNFEKFELQKFHELSIQPNDLEGFTISQHCSITLVPFKLTYAVSTRSGNTVYVYDQGESTQVPEKLNLSNGNSSEYVTPFQHDYPVTHLAIDAEKNYLGCVQEVGAVVVWDIPTKSRLAVFNIPNLPVYISFHSSEPYQLLVIDSKGWARFFNVFSQRCFRSISLTNNPVFSADWSCSNSNIFGAGFSESFTIIDTCKVISSTNKTYEMPELIVNTIKINPNDDKVFATLSRLTGTIQLWRDNFGTHIWKHRNPHANDIAWVHGLPYLLALGHQALFIYDSSVS